MPRLNTIIWRRSWKSVASVLLIVLGLANIYPFLWMSGTSLKSKSEANRNRPSPLPDRKYQLTEKALAVLPPELSTRQLSLIAELALAQAKAGPAAPVVRIWPKVYASRFNTSVAVAQGEIAALRSRGWLDDAPLRREYRFRADSLAATRPAATQDAGTAAARRASLVSEAIEAVRANPGDPPKPFSDDHYAARHGLSLSQAAQELEVLVRERILDKEQHTLTSSLSPSAAGPIKDGLSARQLLFIKILADENAKLHAVTDTETFVGFRMTAEEYADKAGLFTEFSESQPAIGLARKELSAIGEALVPGADVRLNGRQAAVVAEISSGSRAMPGPLAYAERFRLFEQISVRQYDLVAARADLDAMAGAGLLESSPTLWRNYVVVLKDMRFYLNLLTSIAITLGVVFLTIMASSMLGYALARLSFPGKMWVVSLMLIGIVAPGEARIIPIFRMLQGIGLLDGLWGMVLWMTGAGIGNALLMAGFFMSLPKEVEEAARVDGAGPMRTFFEIAFPMARPIVMTVGLFAFMGAWNDFMVPFICTQATPNLQPLSVAVYTFQQGKTGYWHLTNAAAAIMIIPVVVIFIVLQKHIVRSIAVGAVKG